MRVIIYPRPFEIYQISQKDKSNTFINSFDPQKQEHGTKLYIFPHSNKLWGYFYLNILCCFLYFMSFSKMPPYKYFLFVHVKILV